MHFVRSRRVLAVLGAVAAILGATLFMVLPAFGSSALSSSISAPGSPVPPASTYQGITPIDQATGGQSNDCSFFYAINNTTKPQPTYQFRIANPKKGNSTYTDPTTGASFNVVVDKSDSWLNFSATGAAVVDVGIKGGTDETWYNYDQANTSLFPAPPIHDLGGYVNQDGNGSLTSPGSGSLHAPLQDVANNVLYSVSNLTFCYNLGSVAGMVYQDANSDGSFETGTDSTLAGWTVNLYNGSGTRVGTATSTANGTYKIGAVFDGSTYTVCEVPNPSTPLPTGTTTWAQTEPSAGSVTCSGGGELKRGWSITPGPLDNVARNFGNVGGITCSSGPFGIPGYQVGTCKQGQTYVFGSGTTTDAGAPYVSYWVGDPTQGAKPTVERVAFDDPWMSGEPKYTTLKYADGTGYQTPTSAAASPMPYCGVDPRDTSAASYPDSYVLQAPLPAGILPAGATSCLISLKITAPAGGSANGTLVAYVYSTTDSFRVGA
jgi:SdrD B-like domain